MGVLSPEHRNPNRVQRPGSYETPSDCRDRAHRSGGSHADGHRLRLVGWDRLPPKRAAQSWSGMFSRSGSTGPSRSLSLGYLQVSTSMGPDHPGCCQRPGVPGSDRSRRAWSWTVRAGVMWGLRSKDLHHVLPPLCDMYHGRFNDRGVFVKTNEDGATNTVLAEGVSAASRTRIAVLGDSLTFGYGVPVESAYPSRLEALLRSEYTRSSMSPYSGPASPATPHSSSGDNWSRWCLLMSQNSSCS